MKITSTFIIVTIFSCKLPSNNGSALRASEKKEPSKTIFLGDGLDRKVEKIIFAEGRAAEVEISFIQKVFQDFEYSVVVEQAIKSSGNPYIEDSVLLDSEGNFWVASKEAIGRWYDLFNDPSQVPYPYEQKSIGPNIEIQFRLEEKSLPVKIMPFVIEGGQTLVHSDKNGNQFFIISKSAVVQAALTLEAPLPMVEEARSIVEQYLPDFEHQDLAAMVVSWILDHFQVESENFVPIMAPTYHIDLVLRPTQPGKILYNSPDEARRVVEELEKENLDPEIAGVLWQHSDESSMKSAIEPLQKKGFEMVPIFGQFVLDDFESSYMLNAIAGTDSQTGSEFFLVSGELHEDLQPAFKRYFDNDTELFFVPTPSTGTGQGGGLDCLSVEQ